MGKTRVIAETGAGQHGVATATACALLDLECAVYMGSEDVRRQELNVVRMRLLGATVIPVESGSRTLKDAMNEALRDWVTNVGHTFYVIGSVAGPAPYPAMVRDFQAVIGAEAIAQVRERFGHLPDEVVACVGGGSNAMGLFHAFRNVPVRLTGVEAAGEGLDARHGAPLAKGSPGVLHGSFSYLLQDAWGQVAEAHSVSAGLDYPGVGPGARLAEGLGPRQVRGRHGRRGSGGLPHARRAGGHHPRARERPRHRLRAARPQPRGGHRAVALGHRPLHDRRRGRPVRPGGHALRRRRPRDRQPLGPRRQGRPRGGAPSGGAGMSGDPQAPQLPPLAPRLARAFAAPRAQRAALIPYVTGGHPDLETSSRVIATLIEAGADIVELGIPFSDPIADGPVVQRSTHEALLAGVTPDDVLQLAAAHSGSAPFVLLTYVNTVLAFGPERFFARAAASGVEALVIPDLPLDEAAGGAAALAAEAGGLTALAAAHGVSPRPDGHADQHRRAPRHGRGGGDELHLLRRRDRRDRGADKRWARTCPTSSGASAPARTRRSPWASASRRRSRRPASRASPTASSSAARSST